MQLNHAAVAMNFLHILKPDYKKSNFDCSVDRSTNSATSSNGAIAGWNVACCLKLSQTFIDSVIGRSTSPTVINQLHANFPAAPRSRNSPLFLSVKSIGFVSWYNRLSWTLNIHRLFSRGHQLLYELEKLSAHYCAILLAFLSGSFVASDPRWATRRVSQWSSYMSAIDECCAFTF
jgi:hypothetical protein